VVITGNSHHHFVGDLKSDYGNEQAPTVATELLGTAISSSGDAGDAAFLRRWDDVLRENPQAKCFLQKPGYVVCALDRATCRADFRVVPFISTPGAPLETSARFVVEISKAGASRA
jgi:alkaline phosphatase D